MYYLNYIQTNSGVRFSEDLVVFGQGGQEKNRGDVLETVDPLSPLAALTSHVNHPVDYLYVYFLVYFIFYFITLSPNVYPAINKLLASLFQSYY